MAVLFLICVCKAQTWSFSMNAVSGKFGSLEASKPVEVVVLEFQLQPKFKAALFCLIMADFVVLFCFETLCLCSEFSTLCFYGWLKLLNQLLYQSNENKKPKVVRTCTQHLERLQR